MKWSSDNVLTCLPRIDFINSILSVKTKFLFEKIPCIFLAHLVLHQSSHQICGAYEKLNDCCNLSNCEILQELFWLTEDLCYNSNERNPQIFQLRDNDLLLFHRHYQLSKFFTNPARTTWLKLIEIEIDFFTHDQFLGKAFFHYCLQYSYSLINS